MSARRNARPAVAVGAHVRFRGVKGGLHIVERRKAPVGPADLLARLAHRFGSLHSTVTAGFRVAGAVGQQRGGLMPP